jgi:hypothetical protein
VKLTATSTKASAAGTTDVIIPVPTPPRVAGVVIPSSGRVLERDLCVTVSAGGGAASECGDLRLVHALPGVRAYNTPRAPTLIYSSQHAAPHPVVPLEITLDSTIARPDSVVAIASQGGATVGTGSWRGLDWDTHGTPRRVTLAVTPSGGTGVHSLTVEVRRYTSGSFQVIATPTVQVPVVDRTTSPYGRGWWVAGLEQLDPATMVWVGGDGSVRQYLPAGTNTWVADNVDRPDTLKLIGRLLRAAAPEQPQDSFQRERTTRRDREPLWPRHKVHLRDGRQ